MNSVLPVIIVCGAGIVACLVYIAVVCVKARRKRPRRVQEFEVEEDVLTLKLSKRRKR